MKHWMKKSVKALILSAAAGAAASQPLWAEDSAGDELQRRLGQLFEREGQAVPKQPIRPARTAPAQNRVHSTPQLRPQRATVAPVLKARPNSSEEMTVPAGVQAPISAQAPKVTSAPVITPKAELAPPRPAIRNTSNAEPAVPQQAAMPVITPRAAAPQSAGHPLAMPNAPTVESLPAPAASAAIKEHDFAAEEHSPHAFEMPFSTAATEFDPVPTPALEPSKVDEDPFSGESEPMPSENGVVVAPAFPQSVPQSAEISAQSDGKPVSKTTPTGESGEADGNSFAVASEPAQDSKLNTAFQEPGLDGCCPVMLRDRRQLVPGVTGHSSTWKGVRYQFVSKEAKQIFDADPSVYAPVESGRDVILIADQGENREGSLDHAVWFQHRLYLFESEASRSAFSADPARYAR